MALTPAEKQKRYRERLKEKAANAPEATARYLKQPFFEFLAGDGNWNEVLTYLEWAGINPDAVPTFETDDDPEHDAEHDGPYRGSIGRAERLIGAFLDAATELAGIVNRYKCEQIDRAIGELERSDLADASKRKQALDQIVRLTKMREHLDKQVRRSLPQWEVKGV